MAKTQKPFKTDIGIYSDKIVQHILKKFDEDKIARAEMEGKWVNNANQYFNILPPKPKPWKGCSNIQPPASQIVKDTLHANLLRSFFRKPTYVDVKPVSASDVLTAQKRQQYLNWQLREEVGMRMVGDSIFDLSLIFGNCFTKTIYVKEKSVKTEIQQVPIIDENGQEVMTDQSVDNETVTFDGVKIKIINVDDFYISPWATGLQRGESEHIIIRTRVTRNEYYELVKQNDYEDIEITLGKKSEYLIDRMVDRVFDKILKTNKDLQDTEDTLTLVEYYGEFYNEKEDKVYEIVCVINPSTRSLCKLFINNIGKRPLTNYCPYPRPNRVYGESLMDKMKYLQAELNTIHNQRLDSATMRICSPIFYNRGCDFDATKFTMEPGLTVPVDDVRNILQLTAPDAAVSQYREEDMVWKYVEQSSGVNQPMQGVQTSGDTTATEVATMSERAGVRFEMIYQRYENAFKEQYELVALFDQLYMSPEKEFRVLGRDGQFRWDAIKKIEMAGKLDLEIFGNSVSNETQDIQRAQMVYQTGIGNPLIMSKPEALYEHTRYLYERLGVMNLDRMIPKPPQASVRTPEEEAELMYSGKKVEPDLREDAQAHLLVHIAEVKQPEFIATVPPEIQDLFGTHILQTQSLIQAQMTAKSAGMFGAIGSAGVQPGQDQPAAPVGGSGIQSAGTPTPRKQQMQKPVGMPGQ